MPHFIILARIFQLIFAQHHEQREHEHDQTVARIAEHHGEQERKRDDREWRRIELAITGYAIGVDDILKSTRELVQSVMSRRLLFGVHSIQNRLNVTTAKFLYGEQKNKFKFFLNSF